MVLLHWNACESVAAAAAEQTQHCHSVTCANIQINVTGIYNELFPVLFFLEFFMMTIKNKFKLNAKKQRGIK